MNGTAWLDDAGQILADQFVGNLRTSRAARLDCSALFPKLGDARLRRQIVRWIGREYRETTPGILETLRAALKDDDWEVRVSAMLVAGRLGAGALRSAVNDVALPSAYRFGLDERDARLLLAIREITVEACNAGNDDILTNLVGGLSGVPSELVSLVLGKGCPRRDRAWLLVSALTMPSELEGPLPDPLPSGIVVKDRQVMLRDAVTMAWVSPVSHILGDATLDGSIASPIRAYTPTAGFFIARRPLSAEVLKRLGVDVPAASVTPDPAIAGRLAHTPDTPVIVSHDGAMALCKAITRRTGAAVTLPTADELECAARGTDGRRYPWGNGLERLDGDERSPHGIERFAFPAAQWSASLEPSGIPAALGGPASARCSVRFPGTVGHAVRPALRIGPGGS